MDSASIALVQNFWSSEVEKAGLGNVGVEVFVRLFTKQPDLIDLFPFASESKDVEKLRSSESMRFHATNVVSALDGAVKSLNDVAAMTGKLKELGGRHTKYNIKVEYFALAGEVILTTMSETFKDKFSPDVKAAWNTFFGLVQSALSDGYHGK